MKLLRLIPSQYRLQMSRLKDDQNILVTVHYTEGYLIYRYTTQKDSSSGVSLHRRKAHLGFHYTEGKLIWGFTTQKDSTSEVSLYRKITHLRIPYMHRWIAHLGFHITGG